MFGFINKVKIFFGGMNVGRIPGVRAVYSALFEFFRPKKEVIISVRDGRLWIDPNDKGMAPDLLTYGAYDEFEADILRKHIQPGDVALDIGAHWGYFTLVISRLVGETGRVYAFEPDPDNFKLLLKNKELNKLDNVLPERLALSDKSGQARLFLDKSNFGNKSFAKENIPAADRGGGIDVRTVTLDEYLNGRKIDFIKIDVQGAEAYVFGGVWETMALYKPRILMEFWPYGLKNSGRNPLEFLKKLENFGYKFYLMDARTRELKLKPPEALVGISRNRPEGHGWANVFCQT